MKTIFVPTWKRLGAIAIMVSLLTAFVFLFLLPQDTMASPRQDATQATAAEDLVITAVYDGPLSGGVPKGVELYVINDIPDMSIHGLGSANNGGGTDGEEFTFPAVPATAGDFIYVASEAAGFESFFGFAPDYTSGAMGINGDDAVELFTNSSVSDIFGDINVDGNGTPWEYLDGWAYRNNDTGPDGSTFVIANWSFSGPNALDGETTNATATTPVPIGTYTAAAPFSISKDVSPSSIGYHENVTYTVVLENGTAVSDTNVLFTDTLPTAVTFSSWVDQPAGAVESAGEITWSGTVTATEAITFTFVATHNSGYGETITNTAIFSGSIVSGTAEAAFSVATDTPDMTVSKTGPAYAVAGDDIVYTVMVGNIGGGDATGWAITDTLPISVTYVSSDYTSTPVTTIVGSRETLVWSGAGGWAGGVTETFHITATVNVSITSGTIITNDIEISTATSGDPLGNNSDQVETAVYPLVSIYDIQYVADLVTSDASPLVGQTVWVEGVVTAQSDEFSGYIVVQDPTAGAWSGLPLYLSGIPAAAEGDYLRAVGVVDEQFGLTRLELFDADSVQKMGTMSVPAPTVINTNDYNSAATAEQWESVYLEFQMATVTDVLSFGEWEFDDGNGVTRADDLSTSLTYAPIIGDEYNYIRGIGWYSFSKYKLAPRYDADISFAPSIMKAAPGLVDPGELYTYTVTVDNRVGYDLTTVIITDSLPISSTFAYASDGGVFAGGIISWTVPTVGNWTMVERTFAVTATTAAGAEIVNFDYGFQSDNWITFTAGAPITTTVSTNACGAAYTPIYDIQGNGVGSPVDGDAVFTEGVVTAVFQGANQLNGFYIQDETGDGNASTSDGVFVYTNMNVTEGDAVRVAGIVDEYFDLTEITSVSSILVCGTGTITPTTVSLPVPTLDTWEQYEGMLVAFPQGLYATETYNLGRYGEVSLSVNDRLYNPTNITTPGTAANAQQNLNDRSRIQLDDTYTNQNRDPIVYPGAGLSYTNTLRGGDYVANLTGVLDYAFGNYKVQPVGAVDFTVANTRTVAADDVGGTLTVASFNVLNYFNGNGSGGGFPTSRGADTATEFARQRVKIVNAIVAMDADIIGLMEIENDGYGSSSAIQDLVNGLNDATAAGTYAFVDPGVFTIGTDEIAVGMLYKPASVSLAGSPQILDSSVISTFNDSKNRPVLAQSFTDNASGEIVTIAVNHLKSKGSNCDALGDPDTGDGQGNCNVTRTSAAEALVTWLATDPTSSGSDYNLIIGDLNSYAMEDPITAIKDAGYNNLLFDFGGLYAYSYVFSGQHGYLDHALSSPALTPFVTGATTWHINSDEPRSLDYNEEYKSAGQLITLYGEGPYRASDHDPVVVGLDMATPPPTIAITITSPISGTEVVAADGVSVTVPITIATSHFVIDALPSNGGSGDGHWHIWLDGNMDSMVYDYDTELLLTVGEHTIMAQLVDNNHQPVGPTDTVIVTVVSPPNYIVYLPIIMK